MRVRMRMKDKGCSKGGNTLRRSLVPALSHFVLLLREFGLLDLMILGFSDQTKRSGTNQGHEGHSKSSSFGKTWIKSLELALKKNKKPPTSQPSQLNLFNAAFQSCLLNLLHSIFPPYLIV